MDSPYIVLEEHKSNTIKYSDIIILSLTLCIAFILFFNIEIPREDVHTLLECDNVTLEYNNRFAWNDSTFELLLNTHYGSYLSSYDDLPTKGDKMGAKIALILYHYGGMFLNHGVDCSVLKDANIHKTYKHISVEDNGITYYSGDAGDTYWHDLFLDILGFNGYISMIEIIELYN